MIDIICFPSPVWTVIDKGDEVIVFDPCYETCEGCIKKAGGVQVSKPLLPIACP